MHTAHARNKRGECPHNRDEAGDYDSFAAVFFVECVGFLQIRLAEGFGMGVGKEFAPEKLADHEVGGSAQNRGGQKQRIAIVRSLCLNPEIMLFDEVTAALDPEIVREVLDVILNLAKDGMTMLIVTHEMSFARAVANKIVFMDAGAIVEISEPEEFFTNPKSDRAKKFLNLFSF